MMQSNKEDTSIPTNAIVIKNSSDIQESDLDDAFVNSDRDDNDDKAIIQYQNNYCSTLNVRCSTGYGVYHVYSVHANYYQDRRWTFYCKKVVKRGTPSCSRTSYYLNNFVGTMSFMCDKNRYMAGAYSYYNSYYKDRRWLITCCYASSHITSECRLTNYVNSYDGTINFGTNSGEVIVGAFSEYSSSHR